MTKWAAVLILVLVWAFLVVAVTVWLSREARADAQRVKDLREPTDD